MTSDTTGGARDGELRELARKRQSNIVVELVSLAMRRKKFWLLPLILVLLLFGVLVIVSGTAAAPLIYSIF